MGEIYLNKDKLSKYITPILWGLCILVIFNILGNWFDSLYCYFDFQIFTNYITPSITVIAIYMGYKSSMWMVKRVMKQKNCIDKT